MPTGYTHDVQTGKITKFEDFAMQCARAFGALILMRDLPGGAPIPERFEADTKYHDEALADARAKLAKFTDASDEDIQQWAEADWTDRLNRYADQKADRANGRANYEAMLAKVEAWTPPTPDHEEMKSFMIDQLTGSIKFDYGFAIERPIKETWRAWRAARLADAQHDIEYHTTERQKEVERTEGRNRWLSALRASLADQP